MFYVSGKVALAIPNIDEFNASTAIWASRLPILAAYHYCWVWDICHRNSTASYVCFAKSQCVTLMEDLVNIPPAFLYWVGGTCGAYMNDRATGVPRVFMFCIACSLWVAGLFCLAFVKSKAGLYAIVCIVSVPAAWGFNAFLPWRVQTIRGSTSAAFIMAFMNGSGQIPGLWSAQIFRSQYKPRCKSSLIHTSKGKIIYGLTPIQIPCLS